jgi:hypothetical protein
MSVRGPDMIGTERVFSPGTAATARVASAPKKATSRWEA